MSQDHNQCSFIGRLGKDPEVRYMPDGAAVANFSIACGESWKDKNTGEKQERTEWINVVAFRKLAEIIGEYAKKGAQVFVQGKFTTRKWQDKDGKDRYTSEIVADTFKLLGARNTGGGSDARAEGQYQRSAAPARQSAQQPQASAGGFDDDIPF